MLKASIVIPAYNEAHRIEGMLDRYLEYFLARYGDTIEFIVAVNGSTDKTETIVRGYAERHSQVSVLVDPRKIGKGGAILMGVNKAQGAWIGFVDADGATPPHAFDALLQQESGADCIIASRWLKESIVNPRQTMKRQFASRIFNTLVRLLFSLPITDTQCGAKVIKREAMLQIVPALGLTRWAFDVDLLFQLSRAGYTIEEIPTEWRDMAGSRLNVGRASLEMLIAIFRLRMLYSPFKWVVSVYDVSLGALIHRHQKKVAVRTNE